ncbi:hypothetical protein G6F59_017181 [Rhizopus arrhizus]|nr:hypothetical protein G6F59_017181 [Rhizopus arrhizus]
MRGTAYVSVISVEQCCSNKAYRSTAVRWPGLEAAASRAMRCMSQILFDKTVLKLLGLGLQRLQVLLLGLDVGRVGRDLVGVLQCLLQIGDLSRDVPLVRITRLQLA